MSETRLAGVIPWRRFLWPPLLIATVLLVVPHASFLWMSLHRNLGMGLVSATLTLDNYRRVLTDSFYLGSLWLTFRLSLIATAIALAAAFPTAYVLARTRSRWVSLLIALLLVASFMTVVIKALVLGQEGILNHFLQAIGIIAQPLLLLNNDTGVVIGLVQYTLPLLVMLLFSVMQTIPPSLEEAAELLGATRLATLRRVVLPLAMPSLIAGGLISFNLDMGAFTSAVLLGGGKVLTLPVLIQRKIFLDVDYPIAACLATVLVAIVFAFNLLSVLLLRQRRKTAAEGVPK